MENQISVRGLLKLVGNLSKGTAHERYVGMQAVDVPDHVRNARQKADEQARQNRISGATQWQA